MFPLSYVFAATNKMRAQEQCELRDFAFSKHLSGVWLIYSSNNKTRSSDLVYMHEIDVRLFRRVPPIARILKNPISFVLTAVKIRTVGVSSYTELASMFQVSFSQCPRPSLCAKPCFFVVAVVYCSSLLCALYIWNLA